MSNGSPRFAGPDATHWPFPRGPAGVYRRHLRRSRVPTRRLGVVHDEPPPRPDPDHADGDGPIPGRVESVDLLRGLVMVVMVLDHVREFFMDVRVNPTDLSATTPALFLTRGSRISGPDLLLAGRDQRLSLGPPEDARGAVPAPDYAGVILIVLEQTVENVLVFFTVPQFLMALVLWSLGCSMIALAGLIHLPRAVFGGIGVAMIALHNTLDGFQPEGGARPSSGACCMCKGCRPCPAESRSSWATP